ncbi:MAG: peptidoglycan -binding protein [Acetobacteraceae bacterium]
MALPVRRRGDNGLSAWPGYVDALSTLLMVIIFVLLVFVLSQAFLSVALSGRDKQLDRVNRQLAEVSDMLSLERGRGADLQQSIAQLNRELAAASSTRDNLSQQLAAFREQAERAGADRDTLRAERDRLAQQLADAALQARSGTARAEQLQRELATSAGRTDAAKQETTTVATQLADTRRQLAASTQQAQASAAQADRLQRQLDDAGKAGAALGAQLADTNRQLVDANRQLADTNRQLADAQARLGEMQRQMAELDRTVKADKETIAARLSDLARLAEQNRALTALRDSLEKQAQDAAVGAMTEQQRRAAVEAQLAEEKRLSDSSRAQIALFNQQVDELKAQLTSVARALDLAQTAGSEKDIQIANLGQKLNAALATRVEELQRYRSEFFGKLREVLANRPGIQVVGDRFVFQSEVLFPLGSAELTPTGQAGLHALAGTIKEIAAQIPPDIKWVMRVDGHTDRQPIRGSLAFSSNWELSAARAITVVKLLIADGVPADHLAATGFADYQPLDPADTPEAYAKNRRIELRLTDR